MSVLLKISDRDVRELVQDLRFYQRRKRKEVIEELRISAKVVEGNAKELAPVDTGTLRSMIQTFEAKGGLSQNVVSQAEYSSAVEFGTKKMSAQPFLYPAFNAERKILLANLQKIMNRT